MDNSSEQNNGNKLVDWLKNSLTARMLVIGFLTIILLIPLNMVEELIKERAERQKSMVSEINDKWGDEVLIFGPILKIPYRNYKEKQIINSQNEVSTESVEEIKFLYFFPEKLNIQSSIDPESKKRGIYKTAVYKSKTSLTGTFSQPQFKSEDIAENNIIWDKAKIIFQTSNLKGVNEQMNIQLDNSNYGFTSQYEELDYQDQRYPRLYEMESEILQGIDFSNKKNINFTINLSVNGSTEISFIPIGKTTTAQLSSNWSTSSFIGNFLPYNDNKMSNTGFNARWKILDINRPFPQSFKDHLPNLSKFSFGVNFMIPVDEYQKSERATKYGFLVIGLTFLLFFLIQSISKIPIHPFQYLMIGLGLVMFYTLLISISEHSNFLNAYLIASISVIALITLYSKSIIPNWRFPIFIGISLSALYSFIYVIIQLENYALLVGSIGLFIILASVMYFSRKIDWNN
tara:strand:- start:1813 stop:3189 length:1377 start_codon:yes stop_codon:yes gene_type:complete